MESAQDGAVVVYDLNVNVWYLIIRWYTDTFCCALGLGDIKMVVESLRRVSILRAIAAV